ncbi:hypothetical protein SAMN05216559_1652 [Halomicrobium zhouii]|uniref:Uncharacterized protein n=1 Tax=Halomicrobium zhouii TaxID=767519 RepID=A0A1I6KZD9_9EURY|nr:hypothetical protein [Halomicrobium zhouii]SFR96589.1 hypothetical protein SAMN05216559_1652 [Halomicrobium zhouii]
MGFGGKAAVAVLIVVVLGGAVWAMGPQAGTPSDAPDQHTDLTPSPATDDAGESSTDATERQDTDADSGSGAAPPTEDDGTDDEGSSGSGGDADAGGGDSSDSGGDGGSGDESASSGGASGSGDGSDDGTSGSGAADETSLAVGSTSVAADGTAQVRLTLEVAPEGMAGFRARIALDTDVATVEDAAPADAFDQISSVDVAADGSAVTVEAVDDERLAEPGATDVHLATITVGGVDAGTTPLDLTAERLDDDDGTTIAVATTSGEVDVEANESSGQ